MKESGSSPADMAADQHAMQDYFSQIDTLTTTQAESDADFAKEITHKHWKPVESSSRCANRSCRRQFSLLERHHHCRRCGDLFCGTCLKYRRKLNRLAHIDPQGQSYKVCKSCYEDDQTSDGCIRNISVDFFRLREQYLQKASNSKEGVSRRKGAGWRNRLDMDEECRRLVAGFKQCVGQSEFRRTWHEMKSMVSIPDWQKSSAWLQESMASSCQNCRETFGLLRKRHMCKVCGLAVCKLCSSTDLLVYIPDKQQGPEGAGDSVRSVDKEPLLAIIKIVGCPEVEPEVSLYLRICSACREDLIGRQVDRLSNSEGPSGLDMLAELASLHSKFYEAESNVNTQLRDYQEIIDSLENNVRSGGGGGGSGGMPSSNMRTLAKAQGDLSDLLAQHALIVQRLKRLQPRSKSQSHLLRNYIKAKCDFYLDNMSTFRRVRHKFAETSPPEVLDFIQRVMDKNAIVSSHLYLRQLVYESIHLCDKYQLQDTPTHLLLSLEQATEEEVRQCLQSEGEEVEQHLELMKEMIRMQIKDHKLMRVSRRALAREGVRHVKGVLVGRTQDVVEQVALQLRLKAANRSFPRTRKALTHTLNHLPTA